MTDAGIHWAQSYSVCRGIYSGTCSCEASDRRPCDAVVKMQRHCKRTGIQDVAAAELTRCELNRVHGLIGKKTIRHPVMSRDERVGGQS